jgi:putative intracellular protease/amidase
VDSEEFEAMLASLKPPKRKRPLIAIVGLNNATETTDYIMPYGILRRAGIADVYLLATEPGPVELFPALRVQPDASIARFDAQHQDGADYVIVPRMSRDDDPQIIRWLQRQAARGGIIVGVCAGAKVLAAAGLLDGRKATTHWYYVKELFQKHTAARYVPDRRVVVDGRVATTTGITATMPTMLMLIEAIGGRARAEAVAADLGVEHWDVRHPSEAFRLTRSFAITVLVNRLAFWRQERLGIELRPGIDEVSVALVADAWSRTYRSSAFTLAATPGTVETRNGLRIIPDRLTTTSHASDPPAAAGELPALNALHRALEDIANRYGRGTAEVVAMQLEHLKSTAGRP